MTLTQIIKHSLISILNNHRRITNHNLKSCDEKSFLNILEILLKSPLHIQSGLDNKCKIITDCFSNKNRKLFKCVN
jgi:hypothetical protein